MCQRQTFRALAVTLVVRVLLAVAELQLPTDGGLLLSADGILDEQLMPITYLMLDGSTEVGDPPGQLGPESRLATAADALGQATTTASNGSFGAPETLTDASYASALSTLGFHRTMINLYRCKGFLAKQILEAYPVQPLLSKRMSSPASNASSPAALGMARSTMDGMLYDQGSTGYKEWLTKTTTLDDIYENFLASARVHGTPPGNGSVQVQEHGGPTSNPRFAQEEYFDEGIITGYAVQPDPLTMQSERNLRPGGYGYDRPRNTYQQQQHQQQQQQQQQGKVQRDLLEGETASYDPAVTRGDFGYRRHYHHHHHPVPVLHPEFAPEKSHEKSGSLGLKDLFDIALTTLAYLSFGMFILQVIMCITMTKTDTGMMILPTPPEVEVDEEVRRRMVRALEEPEAAPEAVREQNRLAAYVLDSIDIVLGSGPSRDACLQTILCRSNRFSRSVTTIHGYWIGVWSFGVSWIAGCRSPSCSTPAFALKCLSATLIGLGGGDCTRLYPCSRVAASSSSSK